MCGNVFPMRQALRIAQWIREQGLEGLLTFRHDEVTVEDREYDTEFTAHRDAVVGWWAGQPVIEEYLPIGKGAELIQRLKAEGVL